ncbi:MAG: hypothetical protein IT280_04365 [Ignavibacteria bacterium]|nr:hypothetical protein [Ignavibacteria bacterium]
MRTKKVKPPPKRFEYKLTISKEYDEVKKMDFISFRFQTTKEFLTFKYLLKIEQEQENKNLFFNILGFSAPVSDLSNSGFAGYEYRMYDFKNTEYCITVDKKDSDKTKFRMSILRSKVSPIKLSHISRKSFIEIKTENISQY